MSPPPPARGSSPRINRYLADCGLGSRRACETFVTAGRVTVNGEPCLSLSTRIGEGDQVALDGSPVQPDTELVTLLLNKPPGYLCTRHDPQGRPTIFELLPPHLRKQRQLHHAGRLDYDSEGLIVLTSDGEISQQLAHPTHHIEKEYVVNLSKPFLREDAERLLEGIRIETGFARAKAVEKVSKRTLAIVLEQGLKRQIRLMLDALGYGVRRLIRVRIGGLESPDLAPGAWRFLGRRDLRLLFGKTKD